MKVIGVTGPSGAGKTTLSEFLKNMYNAQVIDADKIAKKLSNDVNTDYFKEIIKLFGKDNLQKDGCLNRKKIAEIIYNNSEKRNQLNLLTFKYVVNEIVKILNQLRLENNLEYVCIDVPLLYEAKMEDICDIVIAVIADDEQKISRICERDNIDKELAKQRLKIQNSNQFFIEKADYVIENDGTKERLEKKLKEIMDKI